MRAVGLLLGAWCAWTVGCRERCAEGAVERDGACLIACNSTQDCPGGNRCVEGTCTPGEDPDAGRASSSSSAGATASSSGAGTSSGGASSSSGGTGSSGAGASSTGGPPDAGRDCDANPDNCKAQRDENCANEPCASTLSCDIARYNGNNPVTAFNTCHDRCGYGLPDQCGNGEECLPSMVTLSLTRYELQLNGGTQVVCSLDGGGTSCDTALAFECHQFTSGPRCARPMASCGRPIAPYDLTRNSSARADELCNPGEPSLVTELGITVPGSQFCDTYAELASPPRVFCEQLPGVTAGVCVALCAIPENDGGAQMLDCPPTYTCDRQLTPAYRAAEPRVPCDAGTTCASPAGSSCFGPFGLPDGGTTHLCGWRYGSCQPPQ